MSGCKPAHVSPVTLMSNTRSQLSTGYSCTGAVAPVILVIYGLLLSGSDPALKDGIAADPIGTLATLLPDWLLVPFLIAVILSLVSGAVLGIYSSGLTLLSLGVRIPRPSAALIDGIILTLGTIWVVFFAEDFIGPFQSFLITLGVPLAAWAGIMIADIALRKRDYDDEALFDAAGRYGSVDVPRSPRWSAPRSPSSHRREHRTRPHGSFRSCRQRQLLRWRRAPSDRSRRRCRQAAPSRGSRAPPGRPG